MMWPWGSGAWLLLPPPWCWAQDGDHRQKVAGAGRGAQLLGCPAQGEEQWQEAEGSSSGPVGREAGGQAPAGLPACSMQQARLPTITFVTMQLEPDY